MRALRSLFVLWVLVACAPAPEPAAAPAAPAPTEGPRTVLVRIVDGDTIVVAIGGAEHRVRLIGIDTPERDECFFREASRHLERMLAGKPLRLVRDVSETDRYGRLLRYVYAGDLFVNGAMVRDGYAQAATFPPDVAHALELVALQRAARLGGRGLWREGACS